MVRAEFDGSKISGAVTLAGDTFTVHLDGRSWTFAFAEPPSMERSGGASAAAVSSGVNAPMPGKIVKVAVREGDAVEERALLLVLEAMKMEHRIEAPAAGTVRAVNVKEGQTVTAGATLSSSA